MLVPVILSGMLAKRFGKRFNLAVSSPREAVRALCSQLPGFEQAILAHPQGFRVWADREPLDAAGIDRCTGASPIRIVPIVAGSKDAAVGIILGAALIIAAPYAVTALGMGSTLAGASVISGATSIGTAMILGGITQMLFSPPKPAISASNQSNLLFSGAVNTTAQGNVIPVCYGRMRIGSQVISAGIESVQMPYTSASQSASISMGGGGK